MKKYYLVTLSLLLMVIGFNFEPKAEELTINTKTIVNADEYFHVCDDDHQHEMENEEISSYALACECGGSYSGISTSYTAWIYIDPTRCPKNQAYVHNNQKRTETKVFRCGGCNSQYSTVRNQINTNCTYGSGCGIIYQ